MSLGMMGRFLAHAAQRIGTEDADARPVQLGTGHLMYLQLMRPQSVPQWL